MTRTLNLVIGSLLLTLLSQFSWANMASPLRVGTIASSAISSRDIDILHEKIHLSIDKSFKTGFYSVNYFIETKQEGKQVPLLFLAKDYKTDFKVWVDNKEVKLLEIPFEVDLSQGSPFEKFSNTFKKSEVDGRSGSMQYRFEKNETRSYNILNFKYFEVDLTKGKHTIRIEYLAKVWTDQSDWVNEYSFRYSLSPAKYWKSFGTLDVIVSVDGKPTALKTNLGKPTSGSLDEMAHWHFSKLPAEYIEISSKPKITRSASTFISIGPWGLTCIYGLFLSILHIVCIQQFRKRHSEKRYSWVLILGSIFLSFFILQGYLLSFDFIDWVIGADAGRYHGYTFIILLAYPIFLPIYWKIQYETDVHYRKKYSTTLNKPSEE